MDYHRRRLNAQPSFDPQMLELQACSEEKMREFIAAHGPWRLRGTLRRNTDGIMRLTSADFLDAQAQWMLHLNWETLSLELRPGMPKLMSEMPASRVALTLEAANRWWCFLQNP